MTEQQTAAPAVEKQQFENRAGGWEGVVVINGKGDAVGASVEPGGRIWLSEAEKVLTAEAPARDESNPFTEQTRIRTNPESGALEEYRVTPLVPVSASRFVPSSDRYVPPAAPDAAADADAAAAAREDEPVTSTTAADPRRDAEREVVEQRTPPPATPRARAAVQGNLNGTDQPPAPAEEPPPAPATLGGENATEEGNVEQPPTEEHAEKVRPEVGEETGAATPPPGEPVEGEFAQHEEVGTPDAPAADQPNPGAAGPPAAPWSPGSSE